MERNVSSRFTALGIRLVGYAASAALLAGASAASAQWLVYAEADASARSDSYSGEIANTECNGSVASPSYCGANAVISATKADASESATATAYPDPSYYSGYGLAHGDGFASADLSTGELKIATHASGSGGENTFGGAEAQLRDTIHFGLPANSAPIPITVDIRLDGRTFGYTQPNFYFGASDGVSIEDAYFGLYGDGIACTNLLVQSPCDSQAKMTVFQKLGDWTTFSADHLVGTFYVDPAHPDWDVSMELGAGGSTEYGNAFAEFGHTAALQFELPRGVTYTSDSGVFLNGVSASVPEPAAWALMLVGFAGLGARLRQRRILSAKLLLSRAPLD